MGRRLRSCEVFTSTRHNSGRYQRPRSVCRGGCSLVGVSSDLVVNHHAVYETLGQQARVLLPQLQRAQAAQVLALKPEEGTFVPC